MGRAETGLAWCFCSFVHAQVRPPAPPQYFAAVLASLTVPGSDLTQTPSVFVTNDEGKTYEMLTVLREGSSLLAEAPSATHHRRQSGKAGEGRMVAKLLSCRVVAETWSGLPSQAGRTGLRCSNALPLGAAKFGYPAGTDEVPVNPNT